MLDFIKKDIKKEYFHSITELPKLYEFLFQKIQEKYGDLFQTKEPEQAFLIYRKFVILCGLRVGDWGVDRINQWLEKKLTEKKIVGKKIISTEDSLRDNSQSQVWYNGRPIIIQVNSPALGLSNGDIGICLQNKKGNYRIYFQEARKISFLSPNSLPEHKTAFALSVHKSQGSEFEEVLICLAAKYYEHFNRELLYTAITRAKNKASIIATADVLKKTVQKNCEQTTAVREKVETMLH